MNPETQGKLMVAMLISILAFGMGTVSVFLTGQYHNINTLSTWNTTKQSDFPVVPSSTQNLNSNGSSSQSNSGSSNSPNNQSSSNPGNSQQGQSSNNTY